MKSFLKNLFLNFLAIAIAIVLVRQDVAAQIITGSASYANVAGGARILSTQGTATDPDIGFSGVGAIPANPTAAQLRDGGGGNGIFRPLANTMAFTTGSTERMRITSGGSFGIGLTTPTQRLQIAGGNLLMDYTNTGATTGNIFLGAPTFPVNATPALSNGMRLSYNNGTSKNGFIDVRTTLATDGLIFRADAGAAAGTERMRINSNGNVGISATTPLSLLSIGGSGNVLYKAFINNTNTTHGSTGLRVESSTPTAAGNHTYSILGSVPSGTGWTRGLYGSSTGGAGTAGRAYGVHGVAGGGTSGYNYGVYGELASTGNGAGVLGYDPIAAAAWSGDTGGKWAGFFAGNVGVINGKVVIGDPPTLTTINGAATSNVLLFVRKGIVTESVWVGTYGTTGALINWPDYVFGKGYDLLPLEKVDAFVKENGHLPNVPSAMEIEENGGFELKDMTIKHQEKIEEIYLHLIEMNKKVAALEAENIALKQAMKTGGK